MIKLLRLTTEFVDSLAKFKILLFETLISSKLRKWFEKVSQLHNI